MKWQKSCVTGLRTITEKKSFSGDIFSIRTDRYFKWHRDQSGKERKKQKERIAEKHIKITDEVLKRAISLYDGEISFLDKEIEKIVIMLKMKKVFDQSILCFLSDHGEYFGEKNYYFTHATDLGEPVLRIPAFLNIPSMRSGKIVSLPVQLVDFVPTVLSFLNIPYQNFNLAGRNLKRFLLSGIPPADCYLFSEFHPDKNWNWFSVRDQKMKLVRLSDKGNLIFHLYDLTANGERVDVVDTFPELVEKYNNVLEKWLNTTKEYSLESNHEESAEMKESLRALGYLD